ncbi:Glucan endo-1,3-beta-glucosidase 9 [Platanthera guangdongensis]|uniref:Glucan endo-1,3-beta-glucosidase 9 n=1 Tax=Platanthera guangdongensis TaxID=2320717 RepID=A0ABR2MAZ7_9ASPA
MLFGRPEVISFLLLLAALESPAARWRASAVGVNWGTSSSHPLPSATVVSGLLRPNNVTSVKLFDADAAVLDSLAGSGISVMVGIPNDMLALLNSSKKAATSWVHDNVTRYFPGGGVRIDDMSNFPGLRIRAAEEWYIAVGDEPFLLSHGHRFDPFVVGAVVNIQLALATAKLADRVKVVVPCSSDVYQSNSSLPSLAHFRSDLNRTMSLLLSFLSKHQSPFVLDIDPLLSLQQSANLSIDYFLFRSLARHLTDGPMRYTNFFDSTVDSVVTSLTKAGFGDMDIIIGRVGWPTDGSPNATSNTAQIFMLGLAAHLKSKIGTPLRPMRAIEQIYIFSLLDEDERDISEENYARHFGVFTVDGQAKYGVDLGQGTKKLANARDVDYLSPRWCVANNNKDLSNASASALSACADADCTALSSGGSCSGIGWPANVSYAFNSYYQQHDQGADRCDFDGLGLITTVDPSVGDCMFSIALRDSSSISIPGWPALLWSALASVLVFAW